MNQPHVQNAVPGPVHPTADALGVQRPLPHTAVVLDPSGWLGQWQRRNLEATIPHVLAQVETGEAYTNLARLVGLSPAAFSGMFFTDTDVYKILEAIAWASAPAGTAGGTLEGDLLRRGEELVALLGKVQADDGYLNSFVQGTPGHERWSDPQWGHEFYTAGHLFQAAVAAARNDVLADLVTVAERLANLIVRTHGDEDSPYVDGHPEIETALVELYRLTGNGEYLRFARRQLERRGHRWLGESRFGSAYFQDHEPLRSARTATGHAVRQLYLLTGAVDVAVETGDTELLAAVERIWHDLFTTKTYVSGAHGSRHRDESIGDAYELPPDRAYAETCAAIASLMLNWRLLLATGDGRYADEMETALYNAVAVSTSAAGTEFFYSNPLQLRAGHDGAHEDAPSQRLPWFSCACCPPNLSRLLASVHDYLVSELAENDGLAVHHFAAGTIETTVGGQPVRLRIDTGYPYDGRVAIEVSAESEFELLLRVPGWCGQVGLVVDGAVQETPPDKGYVRIRRCWTGTSQVELTLDLPIRTVAAHPHVDALRGTVAVLRGPVLYAVEQADLPAGVALEDLVLTRVGDASASPRPDLAPVSVALDFAVDDRRSGPGAPLYRPADPAGESGDDGVLETSRCALFPTIAGPTAAPAPCGSGCRPGRLRRGERAHRAARDRSDHDAVQLPRLVAGRLLRDRGRPRLRGPAPGVAPDPLPRPLRLHPDGGGRRPRSQRGDGGPGERSLEPSVRRRRAGVRRCQHPAHPHWRGRSAHRGRRSGAHALRGQLCVHRRGRRGRRDQLSDRPALPIPLSVRLDHLDRRPVPR